MKKVQLNVFVISRLIIECPLSLTKITTLGLYIPAAMTTQKRNNLSPPVGFY